MEENQNQPQYVQETKGTSGKTILFALIGAAIFFIVIFSLMDSSKDSSSTTTKKKTTTSEMRHGSFGAYSFSYLIKEGQVGVTFDGKGVNVADRNTKYEDAFIATTFRQTINTISGYDDVKLDEIAKVKVDGKYVTLKGSKCTYKIVFVYDKGYITDLAFNYCN